MKFCPQCKTGFPDRAETCPSHGGYLSEIVDLKPGMLIRNTYRIVRKLGEGGFGAVYLAQHLLMDEKRALKFLSGQWNSDGAFVARFRREVRTLRQLRHGNVVDCGDLERAEDDSLFFSMEYVDGSDLRSLIKTSAPFDVQLSLNIARGVAEGLGAAHTRGVVHRDIKPENILLARDNIGGYVPKIADFGIVATKENSTVYTQTGSTLLSMPYAAPEQWRGAAAADLDGRADLYALGGVLFEMLTGRTAFMAESYEGWARQHLNAVPTRPSALRAELANWPGLDDLVARLLGKNLGDRPRDVTDLVSLIDAIRYSQPTLRVRTVLEAPQTRIETLLQDPAMTVRGTPSGDSYPSATKPIFEKSTMPRTKQLSATVPKVFWAAACVVLIVVSWQLVQKPHPSLTPQSAQPEIPPSVAPSGPESVHGVADTKSLMAAAQKYAGRKDYSMAEDIYKQVLKAEPNNVDAMKALASVLYREDKIEESAAVLDKLPK